MSPGWSLIAEGHLVMSGGLITSAGPGPAPAGTAGERMDGSGCLATPGLVNCHHHLYQWLTRGVVDGTGLFGWLEALYPIWAFIDPEMVHAASAAALAALALSGCTTTTDHHYVFPRRAPSIELLDAEVRAAAEIGLRFHPSRGSMDLGRSAGGLPPDELAEEPKIVLAETAAAVKAYHDDSRASMLRVAVAPCSPFSVSEGLMRESAELARDLGVRLHTHLAETIGEDRYCMDRFSCTPVEYLDSLGWLGDDVWLAHCVQLDAGAIQRLAATGTRVAHCPSSNARLGAGSAPVAAMLSAGVDVGLGVDGSASQEAGQLAPEMRQALYVARLRDGPEALSPYRALEMATMGGARCLGRQDEIGSLEEGKLADVALWRMDGLGHAGIADPVIALVLGPPAPLELLTVGGARVVTGGELVGAEEAALARAAAEHARRLARMAGR
ncbi:MAG: 8-oxoguanine deaminase [Acidimicrobiales bacterium]